MIFFAKLRIKICISQKKTRVIDIFRPILPFITMTFLAMDHDLWTILFSNMLFHSTLITIFCSIMKAGFVQMPFLTPFQEESNREREIFTEHKIGTFTEQILKQIDQICENEGAQISYPINPIVGQQELQPRICHNGSRDQVNQDHLSAKSDESFCTRSKCAPLSLLRIPSPSTSPPSPASDWSSNSPMTISSLEKSKDFDIEPATPFSTYKSIDLNGMHIPEDQNCDDLNRTPSSIAESIGFNDVDEAPLFDNVRDCIKIWLKQAHLFDDIHPRKTREDRKERRKMEKRLAWINLEEYAVTILHAIQSRDQYGGFQRMAETLWISHSPFPIGYESCRAKTLRQDPLIYPTSFWLTNKNSARFLKYRNYGQEKRSEDALAVRKKAIDSITFRSPPATAALDLQEATAPGEEITESIPEESAAEANLTEAELSMESKAQSENDRFSVSWAQDELWRLGHPLWKQSYDHCWLQHLESIDDEEKTAISNFFFVSADQWFSDTTITNHDAYDSTLQNEDFGALSSGEMAELEEEMLRHHGETLGSTSEVGGLHTDTCQMYQSKLLPYPQTQTALGNMSSLRGEVNRQGSNDRRGRRLSNASYSSLSITNGALDIPSKWLGGHVGSLESSDREGENPFPIVQSSSPSIFPFNHSDQNVVYEEPTPYILEPTEYNEQFSLQSAQQENEALRSRVLELQRHLSMIANEQQQDRHDTIQVMEDQYTAFASLDELHRRHSQALSHALQWQAYGQQQYVSLWTNAAQAMHSYIGVQNRVFSQNFDQNMARLRKQKSDSKKRVTNPKNDKHLSNQRSLSISNNDGGEESILLQLHEGNGDFTSLSDFSQSSGLINDMRRANSLNDDRLAGNSRSRGLTVDVEGKSKGQHLSPVDAVRSFPRDSSPVLSSMQVNNNVLQDYENMTNSKSKRTNNKTGSRKQNHNRWKGAQRSNQEPATRDSFNGIYTASSPLVKPISHPYTLQCPSTER